MPHSLLHLPDRVAAPPRPAWLDNGALDEGLAAIAAAAARHDRDGTFPAEAFARLHDIGVFRLTAPFSHHGHAGGLSLAAETLGRIGAADPSVALVTLWQFLFVAELSRPDNPWPSVMREELLASVRDGLALINAANVEPALGSPARGGLPATTATLLPDGSWLLRGHKIYATGIPLLRWLLVSATVETPAPHVKIFFVDTRKGGFRIEETWDHIGLRASGSHDVVFEDVVAPADFVVTVEPNPQGRSGFVLQKLGWPSILMAALYNGVARAARDWLIAYLNERVPSNLGAPLATLPRIQLAVGQIEALLISNDRLISDATRAIDGPAGDERDRAVRFAPLLKHLVTTNVVAITSTALELTGNPGHSRANPLERHHRDAMTGRIHTPQSDFALTEAGRAALDRASVKTAAPRDVTDGARQ